MALCVSDATTSVRTWCRRGRDPPSLKWSDLKYVIWNDRRTNIPRKAISLKRSRTADGNHRQLATLGVPARDRASPINHRRTGTTSSVLAPASTLFGVATSFAVVRFSQWKAKAAFGGSWKANRSMIRKTGNADILSTTFLETVEAAMSATSLFGWRASDLIGKFDHIVASE